MCANSIPLQTRLPRTVRIAQVRKETDMVTTFILPISLGSLPGQFVMLWLPGKDEIPMSIALDDGENLHVTFFAVGDMTKALQKLQAGELVGIRGPFGTSYAWEKKQRLGLVAGGYGAAPMFFAASQAAKDGCTLDVIIGARSKEHLLYQETFASLPRTTVHIATDDGSAGHKGHNVAVLEQMLDDGERFDQIFACGPERMLVAVCALCEKRGIPCLLSLERYMKCGYGLCGNCSVDPLGIRLCVDGPVVNGELVRQISEFGTYHRDELGRKHLF